MIINKMLIINQNKKKDQKIKIYNKLMILLYQMINQKIIRKQMLLQMKLNQMMIINQIKMMNYIKKMMNLLQI